MISKTLIKYAVAIPSQSQLFLHSKINVSYKNLKTTIGVRYINIKYFQIKKFVIRNR